MPTCVTILESERSGDATFLERLRTAACTAQELGLHWDITLGSGWSTGGVGIDDDGARQLIAAELTLEGPSSYSGALPSPEPPAWIEGTNRVLPAIDGFDEELRLVSVLGAEVTNEPENPPATLGDIVELTDQVQDGTLSWEVPAGTHRVFAIYENRTQHFPAGGAYPGALEDARVIDHLDRRGVEAFLDSEFDAWLEAVADCPPRAVFVDSFELVGELPWTTGFGAEFETSLGYDIDPLLPFLFLEGGESEYVNILTGESVARYQATDGRGARAREDYETLRSAPICPGAHRNPAHLAPGQGHRASLAGTWRIRGCVGRLRHGRRSRIRRTLRRRLVRLPGIVRLGGARGGPALREQRDLRFGRQAWSSPNRRRES